MSRSFEMRYYSQLPIYLGLPMLRAVVMIRRRVLGELCTRLEADPTQPHHQEGNDHEP